MTDIEKIKITDINPAEYNPRKISDDEFKKLSNSISHFGLVDPIIINLKNNKIIGGHQRYDVLLNQYMRDNSFYEELNILKLGDIGWCFTDTDLTVENEDNEKALNIALNRISGEWDLPKLENLLDDLDNSEFDLTLTGFDNNEPIDLQVEDNPPEELEPSKEIAEDNYQDENIEVKVKSGDLYQLGEHRLLCGDATSEEDIDKLLTTQRERERESF